MIGKALEQIEAADIAAPVASRRPEGRQLDYKRDRPSRNDKDSREFPADITSLVTEQPLPGLLVEIRT